MRHCSLKADVKHHTVFPLLHPKHMSGLTAAFVGQIATLVTYLFVV